MTQVAGPKTVVAPFTGIRLASRGREYYLSREGDEFFIEMADPDWEAGAQANGIDLNRVNPPIVKRQIVMTTGSHHMQSYWVPSKKRNMLRQIPWKTNAASWPNDIKGLRAVYDGAALRQEADQRFYADALSRIYGSVNQLLNPNRTHGWDGEDLRQLTDYFSAQDSAVKEIGKRLAKKFVRNEPVGVNTLGRSEAKFTTFDFGAWCPPGDRFSRGEYARWVWHEIYQRCQTVNQQARA